MNAETIPARQLACLLRESAAGLRADAAAVGLITGHGHFLHRGDFRCLIAAESSIFTGEPVTTIRWRAVMHALQAGRLACSRSEEAVLRIAASIADETIAVRLHAILGSLDTRNITLVTGAITAANG